MWETAALWWIHVHSTHALNDAFLLTEPLGSVTVLTALAILAIVWHLAQRDRSAAAVWIATCLSVYLLKNGLKTLVARPRPALWTPLLFEPGYSFPSGHALGTAAFFPLFACTVLGAKPRLRSPLFVVGVVAAILVGVGRLALGIHWPTDVLAGWLLGFCQSGMSLWLLNRIQTKSTQSARPGWTKR